MSRGEYTSIGAERGERGGGRHHGGHHRHGGHHHGGHHRGHYHGGRGWWGGWRGWPWGGWGGWPAYGYAWPRYSYGYALPAYDITDSGYVYNTGQFYTPNYGPSWPYYALPFYGGGAVSMFPHWRSRRHFLHRHRGRVHAILGQELD